MVDAPPFGGARGASESIEADASLHLSDEADLEKILADAITAARHEVLIMHGTIRWERLPGLVADACRRGVRVRILFGTIDAALADALREAGATLTRFVSPHPHRRLHHKVICIDREAVLFGTVNLFPRSLRKDRELLYVLHSRTLAERFSEEADNLFAVPGNQVP